jgi:predicted secreted protein
MSYEEGVLDRVGVKEAPNCVRSTTSGLHRRADPASASRHVSGMEIFMEVVAKELERRGVSFRLVEAKMGDQDPKPSDG